MSVCDEREIYLKSWYSLHHNMLENFKFQKLYTLNVIWNEDKINAQNIRVDRQQDKKQRTNRINHQQNGKSPCSITEYIDESL